MSAIVKSARTWLGTPYYHQASSKGIGADCLGLIRGVWRDCYGREPRSIPPYTEDWAEPQRDEVLERAADEILTRVDRNTSIVAGELLLFRMRDGSIAKHLGIVAQTDPTPTFIHAYTRHGVVESSLSIPWKRRVAGRFRFPSVA